MRIRTYRNNITVNGVNLGLSPRNSIQSRRESNYSPRIQTFTFEDDEIEEPEQKQYFCAVDKSRLDYHKHLGIWICSECFQQYDTKIQDKPVKNKDDFRLRSHHNPYATFDDGDPDIVFVEGINPDQRDQQQEEGIVEFIRSSEDRRIQTIRVKGNMAKALSVMNEVDGR